MPTQALYFITALAPMIWGTSYIVATHLVVGMEPLMITLLRALPAGLLLLLITRTMPPLKLWPRLAVLGALNFSLFWWMLFIAAYKLPGGLAATLAATQPLMVLVLSRLILGSHLSKKSVLIAGAGLIGVTLLVYKENGAWDVLGIAAALAGAASMALGIVLSHKWRSTTPLLTYTAWQLTAGGILLLPFAIAFSSVPPLQTITLNTVIGLIWLGVIGGALSYVIWFNGLAKLGPSNVTMLGFLSPLVAIFLGWMLLDQAMTVIQILGAFIILASVWCAQNIHS